MAESTIQGLLSGMDPAVAAQITALMGAGGLTDEEKRQQRQQGLLNFSAHALMNMYKPTGIGIGAGLAGGIQGYNEAGQNLRRDRLAGAENMQKAIQSYGALQGLQNNAQKQAFERSYKPPTGPQLPSMAPTPANAAALATAPRMGIYEQMQAKAQAAFDKGLGDVAQQYLLLAEKYAPKYKGMETVMGADGKPMLLQTYDNQAPAPVQGGYQPKPDIAFQDLGGSVQAIDKLRAQGGQSFSKSQSPDSKESNALGWANYKLAADRAKQDKGEAYGTPIQITDPATGETQLMIPRKGTNEVVPMQGPDGKPISKSASIPQAYKDKAYNLANFRDNLTAYDKHISELTAGDYMSPTKMATVKARFGALQMNLKNLFELGVIAGPDMSIMAQNMTDPTSAKGMLLAQTDGLKAQNGILFDMVNSYDKNLAAAYNQKPKHSQKNDYSSMSDQDILKALQGGH